MLTRPAIPMNCYVTVELGHRTATWSPVMVDIAVGYVLLLRICEISHYLFDGVLWSMSDCYVV